MVPKLFFLFTLTVFLSKFCFCINFKSNKNLGVSPKGHGGGTRNLRMINNDYYTVAVATWYGSPKGYGSGAPCGFGDDVENPPYSGRIIAGNHEQFLRGLFCGACFQVICDPREYPECSGTPFIVTLTDECQGECNNQTLHFAFSGIAFGFLAWPGQDDTLRNRGQINIGIERVDCEYYDFNIVFKVDNASKYPHLLAITLENINGNGNVNALEIQVEGTHSWNAMTRNFGANYKYDFDDHDTGKNYSLRIPSSGSKDIVAHNVIPGDWKPGQVYNSNQNF